MLSDSSLLALSWGSGQQKVLHPTSCPPSASHTSTARLLQGLEYTGTFSKPEVLSPKGS